MLVLPDHAPVAPHIDRPIEHRNNMIRELVMTVSIVIAAAVVATVITAVVAVMVARMRARRVGSDPRAGWPTIAGSPVWFEDPASGERWIPGERCDRLVVGRSGDCSIPRTRPRHAQIRVFGRDSVDISPIEAAPVQVGGRRIHGPVWLHDDDRVLLGDVALVAHVGWQPDPDDPRIGAVVAGERLLERSSEQRYACARGIVELLDPPVDPAAYSARIRAAEAAAPQLLRVQRVEAGAIVVDAYGGLHTGTLSAEAVVQVGRLLAPLHAAGIGHGGLARGVYVAPGQLRLWPVAPTGDVRQDVEALRQRLPEGWPAPQPTSEVRALVREVLRHGVATGLAFQSWGLVGCVRCEQPFARPDSPDITMFDGHDPTTGRSFGGRTTTQRTECLDCGHVELEIEHEAYS